MKIPVEMWITGHIDSPQGLKVLHSALLALARQDIKNYHETHSITSLCVSFSGKGLDAEITSVLSNVQSVCDSKEIMFKFVEHSKKLSTVEHLRHIACVLVHSSSAWILLSEDNGVSHPKRVAAYLSVWKDPLLVFPRESVTSLCLKGDSGVCPSAPKRLHSYLVKWTHAIRFFESKRENFLHNLQTSGMFLCVRVKQPIYFALCTRSCPTFARGNET